MIFFLYTTCLTFSYFLAFFIFYCTTILKILLYLLHSFLRYMCITSIIFHDLILLSVNIIVIDVHRYLFKNMICAL